MAKAVDREPGFRAAHGCYVENEWRNTVQRRPVRLKKQSTRRGRWILAALVVGFCAGYATHASAADLCEAKAIDVHLGSYHTAKDGDYSNANFGVGLTCYRKGYSVSGGAYRNSFGDASFYATVNYEFARVRNVGFGVGLGAATGYDEPVKVIGGLFATVDLPQRFIFTTLVGPTIEKTGAVFHFVVSRTF